MTNIKKNQADVTVVVTARDRFSLAVRSLENLVAVTQHPYKLIYIDAGSPASVAKSLKQICESNGFEYVRFNHFLSPCQSRNRGHHMSKTKYVAYIENDVMASEGWLKALIKCGEETGAEVIQPLICQGMPLQSTAY